VRPPVLARGTRVVDAALCASLAIVALQIVPLPGPTRLQLSPALSNVDRALRLDAASPTAAGGRAPLSVDPDATVESLALAVGLVLLFWSARATFEAGGVRRISRVIAGCGLVASGVAIVQHATTPLLLYGIWRPINRNAAPYGPFVNRNDLATWLVLGIPLTLGYVIARIESRRRSGAIAPSIEAAVDETTIWLGASVCAMAAALLASLSRSGLTAGVAAIVFFVVLTRARLASRGRGWLILGLGLVALVATAYVNTGAMMMRLNDALANGVNGRREIWAVTRAVIDDFWPVGVGVGAFARVMSVYQPPPRVFAFNHAHDEYLQVVAEGGVGLALTMLTAIAAGAIAAARRLLADSTPVFWVRAGAVAGVAAVAVQNIWETGLRMPANGVLFTVCCAIALHSPSGPRRSAGR